MNKSSDVNREMQGHFWRLGEETPGDRFAPPTAVPGILTISEDGLAKLTVAGPLIQSKFLQLDPETILHADMHLGALAGKTIAGKVDDDRRCVYLEQVGAFPRSEGEEARTFNSTKFTPWARWVSFLGLGSELPNTPFFPYPAERVLRELRAIGAEHGFDSDLDFREVRDQLSKRMSYLDGGEFFLEMSRRIGFRTRTLSRVLSNVLRDLHQEGQIQLTALGDSAERVPFAPDPVDQTGLTGANRLRIVGKVQYAL